MIRRTPCRKSVRKAICAILYLGLLELPSCENRFKIDPQPAAFDQVYNAYLQGDVEGARQALEKYLQLGGDVKYAPGQAYVYYFAYIRLSSVELYAGNKSLARGYLIKSRYWLLRQYEMRGGSEEKAADIVSNISDEKLAERTLEWDKHFNKGQPPHYMISAPAGKL